MNGMKTFGLSFLLLLTSIIQAQNVICPFDYVNNWVGFGDQNNSGEWPIELKINGGQVGEVVGVISYPSLNCGGELTLLQVDERQIVLRENLTYGFFRCANNGDVTLTLIGEAMQFYWYSEQYSESWAQGLLGLKLADSLNSID